MSESLGRILWTDRLMKLADFREDMHHHTLRKGSNLAKWVISRNKCQLIGEIANFTVYPDKPLDACMSRKEIQAYCRMRHIFIHSLIKQLFTILCDANVAIFSGKDT